MAADVAEKKGSIPSQGRGLSVQFLRGCWMLGECFVKANDWLSHRVSPLSLSASAQQNLVHAFFARKKKKQQSESAAWLKVAQSNIDCLLFCHPALSRLQNKHSLVSLHLCLKSTFCVPFRHSRALRQLLSLLHKWNKSPLCKKWWGHGKKRMILLLHQDVIQIPGSL